MRAIKSFAIVSILFVAMTWLFAFTVAAQSKRALLIGISDYGNAKEDPDEWSNISGANDVALLEPLLVKQGYSVTSLVDSFSTYANITKTLKKVAKDAKNGDIVYLHFSMHGQPFEDINGDEEDGWDEALIPVDAQMHYIKGKYEGKNHLLDDEMEKYFSKIRSKIGLQGELFVVIDACHSGTASRGDDDHVRGVRSGFSRSGKEYLPDRTRETNEYFKIPAVAGQSPITLLEACRSYQVNKEVLDHESKTWYGSLSYYVARAIEKCQIDNSGKWIEAVKAGMESDRRLRRQNMVIEKSE